MVISSYTAALPAQAALMVFNLVLFQAFLKIPEQALRELIPVVVQLPTSKVEFLLNSLVAQSSENLEKLIFFVNTVSAVQVPFSKTVLS
jgi:hypothetical protein